MCEIYDVPEMKYKSELWPARCDGLTMRSKDLIDMVDGIRMQRVF